MNFLIVIAVIAGFIFVLRKFGGGSSTSLPVVRNVMNSARVRFTNEQRIALSCASYDKPIFGETPKHKFSQMPNGGHCFDLRTIESLERKGFLCSDNQGGYLITDDGMNALRDN